VTSLSGAATSSAWPELDARIRQLTAPDRLAAIAFSGGSDSAFLLAAAVRELGVPRVVAVTAVSPSLADAELEHAATFAADLGVRHLLADSHELGNPGYVANSPSRCFHCKTEVIDVVFRAAAHGCGVPMEHVVVMTGTNADDVRHDFRPGIAAARRLGAVTPLDRFTKSEIRAFSHHLGLTTADKPAQACLASRIAYGVPVSAATLLRVQRAESALRELFRRRDVRIVNLRVRDVGGGRARIEVDREFAATIAADPDVSELVRGAGFATVDVDPRGFRSGSMNEQVMQPG
jgi:uncharacterized protein